MYDSVSLVVRPLAFAPELSKLAYYVIPISFVTKRDESIQPR